MALDLEFFDRRSYQRTERFQIMGSATIGEPPQTLKVSAYNISAGGLLFDIEKELNESDELEFDLNIDTPIINKFDGHTPVKVKLKFKAVVKKFMGNVNDKWAYGAQITEISENERTRLDELIRS
ncbi:MAG: PilZ domain-containing protein [Oscillospiraceae bacterium]|nr:PilZ domain-containing protein [Oscillospiraceae bacterium]